MGSDPKGRGVGGAGPDPKQLREWGSRARPEWWGGSRVGPEVAGQRGGVRVQTQSSSSGAEGEQGQIRSSRGEWSWTESGGGKVGTCRVGPEEGGAGAGGAGSDPKWQWGEGREWGQTQSGGVGGEQGWT